MTVLVATNCIFRYGWLEVTFCLTTFKNYNFSQVYGSHAMQMRERLMAENRQKYQKVKKVSYYSISIFAETSIICFSVLEPQKVCTCDLNRCSICPNFFSESFSVISNIVNIDYVLSTVMLGY